MSGSDGQAPPAPGRLIVIEGIDGAGTTTQTELLTDWLTREGIACRRTAEPTGGPVGKLLRQVLRGKLLTLDAAGKQVPMHNDVVSLLFAADRMDHLHSFILPLLQEGFWVVSDRYYHSSLVYQSIESGWDWLCALNSKARRPDVTYLLEVPVEVAMQRLARRGNEREIYENEQFQRKLADLYRRLPQLLEEEVLVKIDGNMAPDMVQQVIRLDLKKRLAATGNILD